MTSAEPAEPGRGRLRTVAAMGWIAAAVAVAAGIALSPDLRALTGGAFRQLTWTAVLVTVPAQLAATLLCAASLGVLGPGVGFRASFLSRIMRDAGGNLLVLLPGIGEMVGARALVLAGGGARAAVAASALDVAAETVAQVPYAALAFVVLPALAGGLSIGRGTLAWGGVGLLAALLFGTALWWGLRHRVGEVVRRRLREWREEWRRRRGAMPAAIGLHFIAWMMGGVQVWLAARALGIPLGLGRAVVLESAAYTVRGILFVVPAGVGVQEAGFVVAGLALGIGREQALALSLVLRARDLLLGAPVLLAWPAIEWWRARRPLTPASDGG